MPRHLLRRFLRTIRHRRSGRVRPGDLAHPPAARGGGGGGLPRAVGWSSRSCACAGIDPTGQLPDRALPRFPRMRGDRPAHARSGDRSLHAGEVARNRRWEAERQREAADRSRPAPRRAIRARRLRSGASPPETTRARSRGRAGESLAGHPRVGGEHGGGGDILSRPSGPGHPRVGGEHGNTYSPESRYRGSSPRGRGTRFW